MGSISRNLERGSASRPFRAGDPASGRSGGDTGASGEEDAVVERQRKGSGRGSRSAGDERRADTVLAEEGVLTAAELEGEPTVEAEEARSLLEAVRRVAEGRAIREESAAVMEEAQEWKDYESDVNFRIQLLRARYHGGTEPMTPARRQQMAAHVERTQMEAMSEHAEAAARSLASSMTTRDKKAFLERFGRITKRSSDPKSSGKGMDAAEMAAALGITGFGDAAAQFGADGGLLGIKGAASVGEEKPSLEEAYLQVQEALVEGFAAGGKLSAEEAKAARADIAATRDRVEKGEPLWSREGDPAAKSTTPTDSDKTGFDREDLLRTMLAAGETLAQAGDVAARLQKADVKDISGLTPEQVRKLLNLKDDPKQD